MKIAVFSIPAYGHTNPMLPVVKELVNRGNEVRFYSFNQFEQDISKTGAQFISCDSFLPELNDKEVERLKSASATEMILKDIEITIKMTRFLNNQFEEFKPDVAFVDSVCFWGKLSTAKYKIPTVISTSTFAFNQKSSKYLKSNFKETVDFILGLPRIKLALNKLKSCGYNIKNILSLIQNDNESNTVVYTSSEFQPYSESFSENFRFIGPSIFSNKLPNKIKEKPLIYISLGTVVNDKPLFFKNCIKALEDLDADIIISYGSFINSKEFTNLPESIKAYPHVDQLEVLSKADVFLTHCGMNSVSESLYMATPMVLFPQSAEQGAVARRVKELGAGIELRNESIKNIKNTILEVLSDQSYSKAAQKWSKNLRECSGITEAAKFIEEASR